MPSWEVIRPPWTISPPGTAIGPSLRTGSPLGLPKGLWATRRLGASPVLSLTPFRIGTGIRSYALGKNRHLNIGAGRIVWQDIVRIDQSIKKRHFHQSPTIVEAMQRAKNGNGRLHLLGLVSRSDVWLRFSTFFFIWNGLNPGSVGLQSRDESGGLIGTGI
jgi:BPG-independent PGAM N-terminus (iPGM_N)